MPTIDQLAPAIAAADTDEHIVSQSGTAVKMTRAQILAGVQPQLAIPSGSLLGRSTAGIGGPETLSVGANLILSSGTLAASAMPYQITALPVGTVPAPGDLVPLCQNGTNTAVPYTQFVNGLSAISNIDISSMLVTPAGTSSSESIGQFAASVLPLAGGTMTGALTLSAAPTTSLQAASKGYVDGQVATALPRAGGALSGPLSLAADPTTALQASTKNYVDTQAGALLAKSGGTLTGPLFLAGDPTAGLGAATKEYVDSRVFRAGDTLTGPLILAANPSSTMQAATKGYVDTQVSTALPLAGGTLTGSLSLSADPSSSLGAATKQYVDMRVESALPIAGGTLSGPLSLPGDPSSPLQAATKHYVDTQSATSLQTSGGTLTGPLNLAADPTSEMQAAPKQYVDGQVATALPMTGGVLTGPLILAGSPSAALGAATKQYVDSAPGNANGTINVKSLPYNAQLNGTTDDTMAFKAAYQAASAGSVIYVPHGVANIQNPTTWGIPLTKWVKWIVDGTTLPSGASLVDSIPGGASVANLVLPGIVVGNSTNSAEISQGTSEPTDFAVSRSAYVVNHTGGTAGSVSANTRCDTIIYNSPNNFIWGGLDRLLWAGIQTGSSGSPAQHVGRYVQTVRQSVGTGSSGAALPQPQLWAACMEYRDTTGRNSSVTNSGITTEMDWFGNGPDDGSNRQIQSLVVGQHNTAGAPIEISSVIGVWLAAGHSGHAYTVLDINIPFSTSVLDTTNASQMTGAAAIRMASGHLIAFEPTITYRLGFDSATNVLRWYQGALSFVVGKGISVGFQNICTSNTTLPSYVAGNIVFLAGASTYTVTLPAAATVAAGTGFTFSVIGTATVTISPAGSDAIDNGPITLRQNDRYHIISDGSSSWHEVFRTNSVNPRFTGVPVLPSYTVARLPSASVAGAKAFATNGRKPNEAAGAGTGVEVFSDGSAWISVCAGTQVAS